MTPLTLQLLMPAVQLVGAGLIVNKVKFRTHPALIIWMLSEVFFQGFALGGSPLPHWGILAKVAILGFVAYEVLSLSRVRIPREARGAIVGLTLAASAVLASRPELTAMQRAYLFRSYYLIALAAVLVTVAAVQIARPVLESRRHRAYRIGATLWLAQLAIFGAFVKGGIGYRLLPYTRQTWNAVNLTAYWTLPITVMGMSLAIYASVKRSKRVAKTGDAWIRKAA